VTLAYAEANHAGTEAAGFHGVQCRVTCSSIGINPKPR
jgi:hypothetical protein